MTTTRRAILMTAGGAIAVTAAGAASWSLTRAPKAARSPWREAAEGFGDPRLDALAYAILAPNPHNMQPWRVELESDDAFTLYCDPARLLPETDPPNRQITIGFGCFLELFRQAAAEKGMRAELTYFPEGEPQPTLDARPIARVTLADNGGEPDPLFSEALARRTTRVPFDVKRVVSDDLLARVAAATVPGVNAGATNDAKRVEELRALAVDAWTTEWNNEATRRESIAVTRIGKRENNETPWGLSLTGPLMEGLMDVGVLTRAKMGVPGAMAYDQTLSYYNDACRTAMAFAWSTTTTNTRRDQLESGRAWVRMQLAANAAGLCFHPLSQALQEFPAMEAQYKKAHALLAGGEGRTVQMLARLGFAASPPPAPREPLSSKLLVD
ncbi:MAG TPA: hypothetical protein PLV61_08535 [Parvularculaceae bacterium]|nr:hypothetical protein [Amphiplicatus sp.]HOP19741.1 hypothetical protein [Amphiplicatus sp.]HPE31226.1 hypothetical protein [Parvularculaceae bacterium]HRX38258.1 hypothetical protein [Parvularculaceae bacterium]